MRRTTGERLLGAYVPGSGSDLPLMTPAQAEIVQ